MSLQKRHWFSEWSRTVSDWITTAHAAELSGYHPDHLRVLIRDGKIKAQKFGIVWQVDRGSLMTYMREAEKTGKKRGPKTDG